ncbi:hypothetical protein [Streptomyces sp. NBC_01264]|uniref:hypothetical protein n=1 Tax=Streptomyces sp. NBC_01264 TaxID=2903804 RepID=UPI00224DE090|nr:hypothetical protein [Streptomyces sp. NBC_01264]MCX4781732.1 hypothetical protein [Streptomyces sp. NBC_01264]
MNENHEFTLFANGLYNSLIGKYYDPSVYGNELFGVTLERIRYDVRWSGLTLVEDWAAGDDARTQGVLLALTERCQAEGRLLVDFLDVYAIPTLPVLLGWHSVGTALETVGTAPATHEKEPTHSVPGLAEKEPTHSVPGLAEKEPTHSVPGLTEEEQAELLAFNEETKALNRIFQILDKISDGKSVSDAIHGEVMKEVAALNKRLGEEVIKIEEIPFISKVNHLECDEATSPIECELTSKSAANSPA